jgi:hypothetical protein
MSDNLWVDLPALYHDCAGGFSFADGHAETKKWRDLDSLQPVRKENPSVGSMKGAANDVAWLKPRFPRPALNREKPRRPPQKPKAPLSRRLAPLACTPLTA